MGKHEEGCFLPSFLQVLIVLITMEVTIYYTVFLRTAIQLKSLLLMLLCSWWILLLYVDRQRFSFLQECGTYCM